MESLTLKIDGMTCGHCVRAVEDALRRTPGVEVGQVAIGSAELRYDPAALSEERIAEVLADEGYTASRA
jgi:copper chaperone